MFGNGPRNSLSRRSFLTLSLSVLPDLPQKIPFSLEGWDFHSGRKVGENQFLRGLFLISSTEPILLRCFHKPFPTEKGEDSLSHLEIILPGEKSWSII
jgi:hypothetical protein